MATLKSETSLGQWVKSWLSRATTFCMPPPVEGDPDLVYLSSAAALRDASRRFCNCLRDKAMICALQRSAFLEYRPSPAIIELQVLDRGYALDRLYGRQNSGVDSQTAYAIIRKLRASGIRVPARDAQALPLNRVARFAHVFDFTRDDLDILEEPTDWKLDLGVDNAA
ncbi:hypothetical protein [Microvirga arabica]|uniref:hypothetical protein n=1 Tax=Microvirga arabica TaxID=1128671 RepID=UPI00193A9A44|nr:hypothetical protein [Microvirga arabica]MBM1169658.1 hypothetical protein [Microvirga arabica]